MRKTVLAWAIFMRSKNRLDGYREWFDGVSDHPTHTRLFESRREAREYVAEHIGYVKAHPDLRAEPHGWKPPKVVRVGITITSYR